MIEPETHKDSTGRHVTCGDVLMSLDNMSGHPRGKIVVLTPPPPHGDDERVFDGPCAEGVIDGVYRKDWYVRLKYTIFIGRI